MFITQDHEKLLDLLHGFSIIVEGKNDKKALEGLGLEDIYIISGKSLETFTAELPKSNKFIVLTDFDREGEYKKKRIYGFFENNKMKFNPRLRVEFKKLFQVVKIEELMKISKIKEDVQYGKISSIYNKVFNRSRFQSRRNSGKT
jgi:5S rRNA maturation endonuclease (ribonuclease M5)